jgi:hypothetical protein
MPPWGSDLEKEKLILLLLYCSQTLLNYLAACQSFDFERT